MKPKIKKKPTKSPQPAKVRIIGGSWRGRHIQFFDADGLRPTGDRIRETLFNWLAAELPGSRCLDLFAGSGALGFEALSRGASALTMIENNRQTFITLNENAKRLEAQNIQILHTNSEEFLGGPAQAYDIAFVDPPFQLNLWQSTLAALVEGNWLAPDALIYIEQPKQVRFNLPAKLEQVKYKAAGQIEFSLYRITG